MPLKKLTPEQTASIRHQANNGASVVALATKYNLSTTHIYRIKNNEKRNRRTKQMSTYNGWTNYATWLFYLHHQEDVENWSQDAGGTASDLQAYFEEMYQDLFDGIANIYITDVILGELRDVDWKEILKTQREDDDTYDANWTEEGAITNYLDHVAENKDRERN
jgi:hypothetical protein